MKIDLSRYKDYIAIKSYGDSMYPLLRDQDIIYLKKISFTKIAIDDILTFKKNDRYITHRVIYKSKKYLITKGDNTLSADDKVYPRQIIGKVWNVKRGKFQFNPEEIYLLQSSLYFKEIIKIKKILEKEKIDVIFIKGLPLYLLIEKEHPRRLYADCDILIKPENQEKVAEIFQIHHYTFLDTSISKLHKTMRDKETQQSFIKNTTTQIIFDVHTELIFTITQLGTLDGLYSQAHIKNITTEAFKTSHKKLINGEKFTFLSPEMQILFLCHHLFRDNFTGYHKYELLKKFAIHYTKQKKFNWEYFKSLTIQYELKSIIYMTFLLLEKYYNYQMPRKILKEILPSSSMRKYLKKKASTVNLFNNQIRIKEGMERFINQYRFSPNGFIKKNSVIIQPKVIYTIFWLVYKMTAARSKQKLTNLI